MPEEKYTEQPEGERIDIEAGESAIEDAEVAECANTRANSQSWNRVRVQQPAGGNHTGKEYTTKSGRTVKPPKRFNDYVKV